MVTALLLLAGGGLVFLAGLVIGCLMAARYELTRERREALLSGEPEARDFASLAAILDEPRSLRLVRGEGS